jgi:glycosyltransferase involved in cell wall biosynthesis
VPTTPVLIDATALTSVAAGSGIGTYTRQLVAGLAGRDDTSVAALVTARAATPPRVTRKEVRRRLRRPRAEVIEHAARLPMEVRRARQDGEVFHNPGFHAPWGIGRPWVQTLHDLIPVVLDEPDLAALKQRWRRFGPRYRRASAVIAISRHTADEGIRLLGLDPRRVHVVPHGVSSSFTPAAVTPAADWLSAPPYLLAVSEYSRRKGFAEAFAVCDALADAGFPHRLKVAGRVHPWGRAELDALRGAARYPERIELLGFVPDLVALYQGAAIYLSTTRYEGFGLTALEAMASGAPVVAFSNSAVTEVVEGGGLLVADGDVPAMVQAARRVLGAPDLAQELRDQGLRHAGAFTWARSAALHAEVYRLVGEGG